MIELTIDSFGFLLNKYLANLDFADFYFVGNHLF